MVLVADSSSSKSTFDDYSDAFGRVIDEYCDRMWECEFRNSQGRCIIVKTGHLKGHQAQNGKIIASGSWQTSAGMLDVKDHLNKVILKTMTISPYKSLTSHRQYLAKFYLSVRGAKKYVSHTTCLCCLLSVSPAEHLLPCGHVICRNCVRDFGKTIKDSDDFQLESCPLENTKSQPGFPHRIHIKPEFAGVRILSLDG